MADPAAGTLVDARYAVIGNPVAHSLSPQIHAAFARQAGRSVDYRRVLAPRDDFTGTVGRFVADGGRGFNVTVPFKLEAFAMCGPRLSERAALAGAVNCVTVDEAGLAGDNTDGIGLVADLWRLTGTDRPQAALCGRRLLLVGAGGAARGVIGPLLDAGLRELVLVARDPAKGAALVADFARTRRGDPSLVVRSFESVGSEPFDIVVNATSASLHGEALPLPSPLFAAAGLVYDLMYDAAPTNFLVAARTAGAAATVDGLGMLIEQAAAAYRLWHGTRPATAPVLAEMRALLDATRAPSEDEAGR